MSDNDLQIKIQVDKSGTGARDAKTELDQLKDSANTADSSAGGLRIRMGGLTTALHGLSYIASSAQNGIRGIAGAIGGMFQMVVAHPIGRLIAALVTLGIVLYDLISKMGSVKKSTEELKAATEKTQAAAQKFHDVIAQKFEINFDKTKTALSDLINQFEKLATAAKEFKRIRDEIADAELAAKQEELNLQEQEALQTAGPDEAKRRQITRQFSQKRLDITQEHEYAKLEAEAQTNAARERDLMNQKAQLRAGVSKQPLIESEGRVREAKSKIGSLERQGIGPDNERYTEAVEDLTKAVQERDRLKKEYEALAKDVKKQKETIDAELALIPLQQKAVEAKKRLNEAKYTAETKKETVAFTEGQREESQQTTLAQAESALAQASTPGQKRSAQESIRKAKLASAKSPAEKIRAETEYKTSIGEIDKESISKRADLALQKEQAEEQNAQTLLDVAKHSVGEKGISSKEKRQRTAELQQAQSSWGKEHSDVETAKALSEQIRKAIDPADIDRLIKALESIGQGVKQAANVAENQASQIKNGGLRTK